MGQSQCPLLLRMNPSVEGSPGRISCSARSSRRLAAPEEQDKLVDSQATVQVSPGAAFQVVERTGGVHKLSKGIHCGKRIEFSDNVRMRKTVCPRAGFQKKEVAQQIEKN